MASSDKDVLPVLEERASDHYETLQINPNAEPDTIHRVYRLLAQRFHPDNQGTGNPGRFRAVHEAYAVLSDPERRAQYDVSYHEQRQDRWRLVTEGIKSEDGFEMEQLTRLALLEALYTQRRTDPQSAGIFALDLEDLIGRPREHLEFTIWYVVQKGYVVRGDNSRMSITVEGVDYLEQNYESNQQRRRLQAQNS